MAGVPTLRRRRSDLVPDDLVDRALVHELGRDRRRRHTISGSARRTTAQIATIYPPFWPAFRHNLYWLGALAFVGDAVRAASSPTSSTSGSAARGLPEHLLHPGRPRARDHRPHLAARPVTRRPGPDQQPLRRSAARARDRLARRIRASVSGRCSSPPAGGTPSYVMILYLAGLKALDPSLREAAAIDGASEWQAFFTVVLPALKPINIVLVVITVIEALRAFDIVYIINRGRNGPRAPLRPDHRQHRRRGEPDRLRLGDRGVLLTISLVPIVIFVWNSFEEVEHERRRRSGAEPMRRPNGDARCACGGRPARFLIRTVDALAGAARCGRCSPLAAVRRHGHQRLRLGAGDAATSTTTRTPRRSRHDPTTS